MYIVITFREKSLCVYAAINIAIPRQCTQGWREFYASGGTFSRCDLVCWSVSCTLAARGVDLAHGPIPTIQCDQCSLPQRGG